MKKQIDVDDEAPKFDLWDQNEEKVILTAYRGSKILLSFHPLAWTGVCEKQMLALEKNFERLNEHNCIPLGISVDSWPCKKAWAEHMKLENLLMVADFWPHGEVAQDFGLFIDGEGISKRANVIIDEEGKVEFIRVYDMGELPDLEEIFRHLGGKLV